MRTRIVGALGAAALIAGLAGCGSSSKGYANDPRPPAPVNVAVSITDARIRLSPTRLGAGPVVLLVANISSTSRDVVLTPSGSGGSCVRADASSGPIAPQDNARVSVKLVRGACTVAVRDDAGVAPARLVVGAARASAQSDLLQP